MDIFRCLKVGSRTQIGFCETAVASVAAIAMLSLSMADVKAQGAGEVTINPVLLKAIEEVAVPAIQEGTVSSIEVTEGQVVGVGQLLIQLDDQRARLVLQQAELEQGIAAKKASNRSGVALAETEDRVTKASLQRALDSRKRFPDTPSQAEVDELELRVAQATQHVEQATQDFQLAALARDLAQKNVALATFEVERHQIKAPTQGTVTEIIATKGQWVRPGDPLVRVIRVDRLRVEGFLKREQASESMLGKTVSIVIEGAETPKQYRGKLVFISPVVEPNDRTQRVVAEVENTDGHLGPGLRAKMVIHTR